LWSLAEGIGYGTLGIGLWLARHRLIEEVVEQERRLWGALAWPVERFGRLLGISCVSVISCVCLIAAAGSFYRAATGHDWPFRDMAWSDLSPF